MLLLGSNSLLRLFPFSSLLLAYVWSSSFSVVAQPVFRLVRLSVPPRDPHSWWLLARAVTSLLSPSGVFSTTLFQGCLSDCVRLACRLSFSLRLLQFRVLLQLCEGGLLLPLFAFRSIYSLWLGFAEFFHCFFCLFGFFRVFPRSSCACFAVPG